MRGLSKTDRASGPTAARMGLFAERPWMSHEARTPKSMTPEMTQENGQPASLRSGPWFGLRILNSIQP